MSSFSGILQGNNKDEAAEEQNLKKTETKFEQMLTVLPKEKGWVTKSILNYDGAWVTPTVLKGVLMAQHHFQALPTDVLLATFPKAGTTWLKALGFAIVNRRLFDSSKHPLLTKNSHECVPSLEVLYLQNQEKDNQQDDHDDDNVPQLPTRRVLATHIPYHILPDSVRSSSNSCRLVYMAREPKDVLVSGWHHMKKLRPEGLPPLSFEEASDMFCRGVYHFGAYWDHVSGYYDASIDNPGKVLILTYEDMKRDPIGNVIELAKHLDHPFTQEELKDGVVEEIVKLCSFETLSNLEVNKSGVQRFTSTIAIENHVFYRKGRVGDWEKHLTPEMARRMDQITEDRFQGRTHLLSSLSPP